MRVWVPGSAGMAGSATVRKLLATGIHEAIPTTRGLVDCRKRKQVKDFLRMARPDAVVFCAGLVGGIQANATRQFDFLLQNAQMACTTIQQCVEYGVKRFIYLGSTCVYPADLVCPITEEELLRSRLEKTNEGYAIAKIVGIKLCEYARERGLVYHSIMPTNLYGPGDNYDEGSSHVVAALIRRIVEAKRDSSKNVTVWGSGKPKRELLHVDDLASAIEFLLGIENPPPLLNIGSGDEVSIRDLASMIATVVDYDGEIVFDRSKPDGVMRKLCSIRKISGLGWKRSITLQSGLERTIKEYMQDSNGGFKCR